LWENNAHNIFSEKEEKEREERRRSRRKKQEEEEKEMRRTASREGERGTERETTGEKNLVFSIR
jgi:hypothetical protein